LTADFVDPFRVAGTGIPRLSGTVLGLKMRQVLGEIISADTALATYAYICLFQEGKDGGKTIAG